MKKKLLGLILIGCMSLVGCQRSQAEDYITNTYKRGEQEQDRFDISLNMDDWSNTSWQYFKINNQDSSLAVQYEKVYDNAYGLVYTEISGKFADFSYLNIKVKGVVGETLSVRLFNDLDYNDQNIIGSDPVISLGEDYVCYSLKIKDTYQTRMDIAKYIGLIPDLGLSSGVKDYFYVDSLFFSKEVPEGYEWKNTSVDSGEDEAITVNGWTTYTWTGYTLYASGSEVQIWYQSAPGSSSVGCADYAYLEKEIYPEENDNLIKFQFTNDKYGKANSTTHISFLLRGDVNYRVEAGNGVQYAYNVYHEVNVYNYYINDETQPTADENGIITLSIPIGTALETLKGKHENGLRLVLLVESNLAEKGTSKPYKYNGYGKMTIKSLQILSDESVKETSWTTPYWTKYNISLDSDLSTLITFNETGGDYAYCETPLEITNQTSLSFKFKNNSYDGKEESIERISFILRGDVSEHISAGDIVDGQVVEYDYDNYYEQEIYNYNKSNTNEVTPDSNGVIYLNIDLNEALQTIGDHHSGGYHLVLLIESKPIDGANPNDQEGSMSIIEALVK